MQVRHQSSFHLSIFTPHQSHTASPPFPPTDIPQEKPTLPLPAPSRSDNNDSGEYSNQPTLDKGIEMTPHAKSRVSKSLSNGVGKGASGGDEVENWPADGRVEFRDVYLRYRPGTPLVLRGVSFAVRSGERIGICGRSE